MSSFYIFYFVARYQAPPPHNGYIMVVYLQYPSFSFANDMYIPSHELEVGSINWWPIYI